MKFSEVLIYTGENHYCINTDRHTYMQTWEQSNISITLKFLSPEEEGLKLFSNTRVERFLNQQRPLLARDTL